MCYLTSNSKKLCGFENCEKCFNKSFASFDGITENWKKKVDCWHPTENGDIKPWEVTKCSHKKNWFKCDSCPHSFDSALNNITNGYWCPYCCNRKMCENNEDKHCITCFNKSFASLEHFTRTENSTTKKVDCWHSTKNKDIKPWKVFKGTDKKFWFKCDNCPHSFNSALEKVSNGQWCHYCCNQKMCENNEDKHCITCYNKSFASLEDLTPTGNNTTKKVECWDYENDKNPWEVFKNTHKKYWFNCDNCPHSFDSALNNITCHNRWCPYCCISSKKFCNKYKKDYNSCQHCFNKSFASFDGLTINGKKKIECWHPTENGDIKPWEVFKCNNNKFWFKCVNCPHSFDSALNNITCHNRWCPYCCNPPKKMCENNEDKHCITCFNKSFASFDGLTINGKKKVECWHLTENGDIKPCDLFKCSSTGKFCFTCDNCHDSFDSALSNITNGNWCPHCKNKTALKLHKWLQILEELYPNYTIIITKEYKKKWCRNPDPNYKKKKEPCYYPYDFNIQIKELKLNIIIELDGRQHFEYVSLFENNVEERQIIDLYKMFQAFKNNHSFIRIFQEDVYLDNNDWENKLKHCIDKIIKSNHIMSLYVDNGNIYDIYKTRDPYKILKFKEVINQIKNQ